MFCKNVMRVNKLLLTDNTTSYGNSRLRERHKEGALYDGSNKTECNITKNRPAERVSLGGSERLRENQPSFTSNPKLVTNIAKEALYSGQMSKIPNWAEKMGAANWFEKITTGADKHETFFEAVTSLVVAGMLKPVCVLAMPGAEMEDKQMSATKNAVSAFIGFGISNLLLSPCSNGVNKVLKSINSKDPTKYIKDMDYIKALKNEELLPGMKSTLGEAFKTAYKKTPDVVIASPLKAGITIALVPYMLNFLFKKDKKDKEKKKNPVDNPMNKMPAMNLIRMQNNKTEAKPAFNGNSNNNSKQEQNSNSLSFTGNSDNKPAQNSPSFTGGGGIMKAYNNTLGEGIAKLIGKIAPTKVGQKLVEGTAHFDKPSARWSDLASIAITFCYVQNTAKSEKIDEERKLPLMINNVMVTAASSTAAFLIDKYTDKPMEYLLRGFIKGKGGELHKRADKNIIETLGTALEKGKDAVDIDALKLHSDELLKDGLDGITDNLKQSIETLKNNETVQRAVKEKIIDSDDIAKMAAAGFEKQAKSIYGGISKAKSLTVFTLTVRFLVTVLMTPVIGQVVAFVNKKLGRDKGSKENKNANPQVPPPGSETLGMKDYMSRISNSKL